MRRRCYEDRSAWNVRELARLGEGEIGAPAWLGERVTRRFVLGKKLEQVDPLVKKRRKSVASRRAGARRGTSATLPPGELSGLLDDVKATVLALLASLQAKEADLRKRLQVVDASAGVKTGLSDIRLFRHWADRTLRTVELLERGQQQGDLQTLLADLGEFADILHAHDAEQPPQPIEPQ